MAAWVAGLVQEQHRAYGRTLRQLLAYDPDQIQALYAAPHRWTPFARQASKHRVGQTDLSRWDYKHQVLESTHFPNWRVLLWVKLIEAVCQLRPRSLYRLLAHPDRPFRDGRRWYSNIGRRVWLYEIWQWFFVDRRTRHGPALAEFLNHWSTAPRRAYKRKAPEFPDRPISLVIRACTVKVAKSLRRRVLPDADRL